MAIKPASDPTFATNAVAAAGPDIGLATRLAPGGPMRADGMYRDRRMPSRVFNALLGTLGDWFTYFADLQIRNWKLFEVDFFPSTFDSYGLAWVPESTAAAHDAFWLVFGSATTPSLIGATYPSATVATHGTTSTPTLTRWKFNAVNNNGSIMVAAGTQTGANTTVYRSVDRGVTWAASNVIVGTNKTVLACVWDPVNALFVLSVNGTFSTNPIYTSPDGNVWTQRVSPTGVAALLPSFLVVGGGKVVVLSVNKLAISSDGGVTWGAAVTTPVSFAFGCFDALHGWTLTDAGTLIYTSTALAVFTLAYTGVSIKGLASDGQGVSVASVNYANAQGLLYSNDGWLTNRFVAFGSSASDNFTRYPRVLLHNRLSKWGVLSTPSDGIIGASTLWAFHESLSL